MKKLILSVLVASMALTGCQSESNTAQKAETSVKSVVQSKTERNKANAIAFYLAILASAVLTVLFFYGYARLLSSYGIHLL